MADASVALRGLGSGALRHGLATLRRVDLRRLLKRRRPAAATTSTKPGDHAKTDAGPDVVGPREPPVGAEAPLTVFPLLNAYAAASLEIEHRMRGLDSGAGITPGPVAIQALLGEVLQELEPLAHKAELELLRDVHSGCDGVCCADPVYLRSVICHLVLRALSMEQRPGHVRIMVAFAAHEAHILILSRTPDAALAHHGDAGHQDLIAPQRLLQAMGGSLVIEPRRAGYLPLCIAVPALSAAFARQAA